MQRPGIRFIVIALVTAALMLAVVPAAFAQGDVTHVVQPGENLFRISLRYGVTVQSVASANGITNPNLIYVGQSLKIPGASNGDASGPSQPPPPTDGGNTPPPASTTTYTVKAGDTLTAIARNFNTTVRDIAQRNNISNVNLITVGQVLNISGTPTTGSTPPPTTDTGDTGDTGNTPPPPSSPSGFELGGHVLNFNNVDTMRQANMKWAKVQIPYTLGSNTDSAAAAINNAHLNGFKVLLGILGDPGELSATGLENYIQQFSTYLGNVATLGPEAIEIWNEPNITTSWPAGQVNPASYTQMLSAGYTAIKNANSNVMVISAAMAPTGFFGGNCTGDGCDDAPFLRGMAQAGAANSMDCIGAHYNEGVVSPTQRSGDPRGNPNHYSRYFGTMLDTYYNAFGGARPVCWTELGYLSMDGFNQSAPAGFEWGNSTTAQQQAIWLGEAAQLSRNSGRVPLMIVWNVNFTAISPDPMGGFAILRPDQSCPACATLAQATQ